LLAWAITGVPDALIATNIGVAIDAQSKQLIGDETDFASAGPVDFEEMDLAVQAGKNRA